MTSKKTVTNTYDEQGCLTKTQTVSDEGVYTEWFSDLNPLGGYRDPYDKRRGYTPVWDTTPRWLGTPAVSNTASSIRELIDPYDV